MATDLLGSLKKLLLKRPMALLRFPEATAQGLLSSKHGTNRFTLTRPHEEVDALSLPTLCLVELQLGEDKEFYVGAITAKAAVATLESRVTLIRLQPLRLASVKSLTTRLRTKESLNK